MSSFPNGEEYREILNCALQVFSKTNSFNILEKY